MRCRRRRVSLLGLVPDTWLADVNEPVLSLLGATQRKLATEMLQLHQSSFAVQTMDQSGLLSLEQSINRVVSLQRELNVGAFGGSRDSLEGTQALFEANGLQCLPRELTRLVAEYDFQDEARLQAIAPCILPVDVIWTPPSISRAHLNSAPIGADFQCATLAWDNLSPASSPVVSKTNQQRLQGRSFMLRHTWRGVVDGVVGSLARHCGTPFWLGACMALIYGFGIVSGSICVSSACPC